MNKCPNCGSKVYTYFPNGIMSNTSNEEKVFKYECCKCHCLFIEHQPENFKIKRQVLME